MYISLWEKGMFVFAHFQTFRLDRQLPERAPSIGIGKPLA